jgi:hypothetical protein
MLMQGADPKDHPCIGTVAVPIHRLPIAQELDTWFDLAPDTDSIATVRRGGGSSAAAAPAPAQLRLGFNLSGDLRPEVRGLLSALGAYTAAVDAGVERAKGGAQVAAPFVASRAAAAAAVPLGLAALSAVPLLVVASPLLLPIAAAACVGLAVLGLVFAVLAASSKDGR